jgi:metallo-beta-lactamase class B
MNSSLPSLLFRNFTAATGAVLMAASAYLACASAAKGQPTEAFRAMNRPAQPFQIISNIYYVGASDIASYLIVTPQGHILIEGGFVETVPLIEKNVRELGFKVEDIKILLTSHAHFDHVGGMAELKRLTGAALVATAPEAEMMQRGGRGDFQYGDNLLIPEVRADRIVADGDTVALGGVVLTAHVTPGHTKGSTTWTMRTAGKEGALDVVFMASLSTPGYDLVHNPAYPNIGSDILRSVAILKTLPCDVFLAPHGFAFALEAKRKKLGTEPNPFIDPIGYRAALDQIEKAMRASLAALEQKR